MSSTYKYPPTEFDPKPSNYRPLLFGIAAAVVGIDRLSKRIVDIHLPTGQARTIIPGVLRITHVLNTGAAFSLFAESASPLAVRNALIVFSIAAVLIVAVLLWRVGNALSLTSVALALILGGAFGNLYDRVRFSSVLDFIEVHIIHYHWPDFNIADSCIVIGACLLLIEIFRPQPVEGTAR
jgi:signal peptidase II